MERLLIYLRMYVYMGSEFGYTKGILILRDGEVLRLCIVVHHDHHHVTTHLMIGQRHWQLSNTQITIHMNKISFNLSKTPFIMSCIIRILGAGVV